MINGQSTMMVDASERTSLYYVIKGLREPKAISDNDSIREMESVPITIARLLYIVYTADKNSNADTTESQLTKLVQRAKEKCATEITGFLIVKGQFAVHFVEGESRTLNIFLGFLYEEYKKEGSPYSIINIIAFTEENPSRMFDLHGSDNVFLSNMTLTEVEKSEQQMQDRCWAIFDMFCKAGQNLSQKLKNDKNAGKYIWREASNEVSITTEDLQIMTNKRFMSINEYVQLYLEDMDIELDGELEFPLKQSLIDILQYADTGDLQRIYLREIKNM